MGSKKKRVPRTPAQASGATGAPAQKKRRWRINTPSLIFIGLLVLGAVAVAIGSVLSGEDSRCPPGQVWSDAHNHCH